MDNYSKKCRTEYEEILGFMVGGIMCVRIIRNADKKESFKTR